jgi:hypothetical protein
LRKNGAKNALVRNAGEYLAKGPSPVRELTGESAGGANDGLNQLEIQGKNILKFLSVGVEGGVALGTQKRGRKLFAVL